MNDTSDRPEKDDHDRNPDGPPLGADGTIPNAANGLAAGHDPDGSHFNPEEEPGDDGV